MTFTFCSKQEVRATVFVIPFCIQPNESKPEANEALMKVVWTLLGRSLDGGVGKSHGMLLSRYGFVRPYWQGFRDKFIDGLS